MFITAVKAKAVGLEGDGRPICRCEKDKELAVDVRYSLRAGGLEADAECPLSLTRQPRSAEL